MSTLGGRFTMMREIISCRTLNLQLVVLLGDVIFDLVLNLSKVYAVQQRCVISDQVESTLYSESTSIEFRCDYSGNVTDTILGDSVTMSKNVTCNIFPEVRIVCNRLDCDFSVAQLLMCGAS